MKGRILLLFVLIVPGGLLDAQQSDFFGQPGLIVSRQMDPSWHITWSNQALFNQNLNECRSFMSDFSVGYRLTKKMSTEMHYRAIRFRELNNTYSTRHLFYHTLSYSAGAGDFSFRFRHRLQQMVYGDHFNDNYKGPRWYERLRIKVGYRLNYYWTFYASTELFIPLSKTGGLIPDQLRHAVGITRAFNDRFAIDAGFSNQQEVNQTPDDRRFGIMLLFYYNL
jgi:Protein of unknown function (DUF2490)